MTGFYAESKCNKSERRHDSLEFQCSAAARGPGNRQGILKNPGPYGVHPRSGFLEMEGWDQDEQLCSGTGSETPQLATAIFAH